MPSTPDRDDDPFLITAELEIRSILRSLQRHSALLRMYMQGDPDQSIMTTVLGIDDSTQRVIVDVSRDQDLNARLLKSPEVVFDTQLDHVNIHFTATHPEACTYDSLPALSLSLPAALRRIQRREFYRVEIPVGEPATCTIPLVEPGKPPRRAVVRMKDISAGGVALLDTDMALPHQAGTIFRNVMLSMPEVGETTVDLDVLRVHAIELPSKKEIVEMACKFVAPSNATSMLVQSYIGRLERRLIAKRRGF